MSLRLKSLKIISGKYLTTFRWLRSHFSMANASLLFLAIGSASYFVYFAQPTSTTIFINQFAESTTDQLVLSTSSPISLATLLANEKANFRQTNSSLTKILQLLEEERSHVDYSSKSLEEQKAILDSHREFFKYAAIVLRNTPYPGVENYTRYAVARLGLSPLANAEQLIPEFGAVINDVLSFRYPITIPSCAPDVTANQSVFIAVISAPNNFEKRKMIRQTWKNHVKEESEKGALVLAGFGFILGQTTNNLTQSKIEEESKANGDIIQIGVSDFYRNLSLKLTGLFNWLHRFCSKVDFLLKVDDDVYVNARNLVHFVQSYRPSNGTMFGLPAGYLNSIRGGKWNISYEEWPWSGYPKYYFGPAALIHGSALLPLLAAFQTTPLMPFEDVYYSGICREKAGITIRHPSTSFRVLALNQPKVPTACDLRHFIAWVTVSGTQLNNSHVVTDNFYHNRSRCIVTDSNGINSTIDHNEPVQFYFH